MNRVIRLRLPSLVAVTLGWAAASATATPHDLHHPEEEHTSESGYSLTAAWNSHYVSEGRDNLFGGSLLNVTIEGIHRGFVAGVWYAANPDGAYDEMNLYLLHEFSTDRFDFYVGYTHLQYFKDTAQDNELGFGATWTGLPCGISPAIDAYYSFDAGRRVFDGTGWFFEFSVEREFEISRWLVLSPSAVLGINSGYIKEGHNGANHAALRLDASIRLTDRLEIGANLTWNKAINSDPDKDAGDILLRDFLHGGVSATLSF